MPGPKGPHGRHDGLAGQAQRLAGGIGGHGILSIVGATQGSDAGNREAVQHRAGLHPDNVCALQAQAIGKRIADRQAHHEAAGALGAVGHGLSEAIVDADDRRAARLDAGDQPFLDAGIGLQRAMAVQMVGRDVQADADRGVERRRQVDLERGALDDMEAAGPRRLQRQDGGADIAAHLHVAAALRQHMGDKRGRGRLAVGAGDGNEGAFGALARR